MNGSRERDNVGKMKWGIPLCRNMFPTNRIYPTRPEAKEVAKKNEQEKISGKVEKLFAPTV